MVQSIVMKLGMVTHLLNPTDG